MSDFLRSRVHAFGFAFEGLRYVLKTQKNAWIHFVISMAVIVMGLWLNISVSSWVFVFLAMGLVWAAECVNTALESLVDLVSPEPHPLAKIAKDAAAAAVLVCAMTSVIVGLAVLGPSLVMRLFQN